MRQVLMGSKHGRTVLAISRRGNVRRKPIRKTAIATEITGFAYLHHGERGWMCLQGLSIDVYCDYLHSIAYYRQVVIVNSDLEAMSDPHPEVRGWGLVQYLFSFSMT